MECGLSNWIRQWAAAARAGYIYHLFWLMEAVPGGMQGHRWTGISFGIINWPLWKEDRRWMELITHDASEIIYDHWLTLVRSCKERTYKIRGRSLTLRGHLRSKIFSPLEGPYKTSHLTSIDTFSLSHPDFEIFDLFDFDIFDFKVFRVWPWPLKVTWDQN